MAQRYGVLPSRLIREPLGNFDFDLAVMRAGERADKEDFERRQKEMEAQAVLDKVPGGRW